MSSTKEPSKDEKYQNGLTLLKENKKMGMITQDQYDRSHDDLVKKIYGTDEQQKEV